MKELLLGCGYSRDKRLYAGDKDWHNLVTLDISERVKPDIVHDLNNLPYPFEDGEFDEIHAYEVLEHCGTQGDYKFFFSQFAELYRMLKDGGHLFITCPNWQDRWAWGDPGHTRIIGFEQLCFLDRDVYEKGPDSTPMTDYRDIWSGDFKIVFVDKMINTVGWILKKRTL